MNTLGLTEAAYYILLSLPRALHGYGVMQNVEQLSKGRVHLATSTLYGALNTLLSKGWIAILPEETDSRKKQYIITQTGQAVLRQELTRLRELVDNGEQILGEMRQWEQLCTNVSGTGTSTGKKPDSTTW